MSGLELGGLVGSLLAGRLSDASIRSDPEAGATGKRVQVSGGSFCRGAVGGDARRAGEGEYSALNERGPEPWGHGKAKAFLPLCGEQQEAGFMLEIP